MTTLHRSGVSWLRLALTLILFGLATPFLMLWQALALSTGLIDQRRAPRYWHRMVVRLLGLRIQIYGKITTQRPLLIVANHISWTDIMVLGASTDAQFIAKEEVAGWPIFGALAKLQRTIFIDRTRRYKAGEQANIIATRLNKGEPLVLFPEGTTSDGNRLLPFKTALFSAGRLAPQASENITVQPAAIVYSRLHGMPMGRRNRMKISWIGDQTLVPHLKALLSQGPIDVELHFGKPITYGTSINRKHIAREAEDQIRLMLIAAYKGCASVTDKNS